jgi:hypothetical protein
MTLVKGAVAALILLIAASLSANTAERYHVFRVGERSLRLLATAWERMENEDATVAESFSAVSLKRGHAWPQVVTVFKLPMSEDRKLGIRVTKSEYIEPFVVHPGKVTVQIRVDRGSYWVLSRETFLRDRRTSVDLSRYKPFLSLDEQRALIRDFQERIDSTRAWINVTL